MGLVFDTSIFIHAERANQKLVLSHLTDDEDVFISSITVSELLVGAHMADNKNREIKRKAFAEKVLVNFTVLPFTEEIARVHAELKAKLLKNGKLIGAHDLLIAATAISWGYSVLSFDSKDFKKVPGLQFLSP